MLNLVKSKLRKELLGLYFSKQDSFYYVRELSRILDADPTNVSRELGSLERQGLFLAEKRGTQKYYRLNKTHPTFKELRSIVAKTIGVPSILKQVLSKVPGKNFVVLYGSAAAGKMDAESDIDVLIVSNQPAEIFYKHMPELEKKLGREVSLTIYKSEEFERKKKTNDPFIKEVFKSQREVILGKV